MEPDSIARLKQTFLATQVRLLSAPLSVPASAYTTLPSLPDKSLTDLLCKVNEKIQANNRSVFPPQAQRHVAEQINTLYWNEVLAEYTAARNAGTELAGPRPGETTVRRALDLVELGGVMQLGESWRDVAVVGEEEEAEQSRKDSESFAQRYTEERAQLLELCRRRDEAEAKLARYKRLQELLEPYENPQENIQPNLVTRDGELSREMDRMRVLLARVTARMDGDHSMASDQRSAQVDGGGGAYRGFEDRLATVLTAVDEEDGGLRRHEMMR
jgi:hypothetical protein